ncbi:hypothetical protein BS78_08G158800 [Paspalum vaginatum]|nr:hypothetical protein BS78_08G158800 [Paspalum vaginatum]
MSFVLRVILLLLAIIVIGDGGGGSLVLQATASVGHSGSSGHNSPIGPPTPHSPYLAPRGSPYTRRACLKQYACKG